VIYWVHSKVSAPPGPDLWCRRLSFFQWEDRHWDSSCCDEAKVMGSHRCDKVPGEPEGDILEKRRPQESFPDTHVRRAIRQRHLLFTWESSLIFLLPLTEHPFSSTGRAESFWHHRMRGYPS
jgi:hypothetical protein